MKLFYIVLMILILPLVWFATTVLRLANKLLITMTKQD